MFWVRFTNSFTASSGNDAEIVNLLSDFQTEYGADLFGFTVTRIVGNFKTRASGGTVPDTVRVSSGIRVEDQQAIANTNTDTEQGELSPFFDPYTDWMWARNEYHVNSAASEAAVVLNTSRVDIDLRSQRRLDELGQSLYLFNQFDRGTTVTSISYQYNLNMLMKRP